MRWNFIAAKIEALWLILLGIVVVGYVRSGELKLFLSGGWIIFTEVFGVIMITGGAAFLLYCRDNEKDNVLYRIRERGAKDLIWRFVGIGLLLFILAVSMIAPYSTVLQDPFNAETVGGASLADIGRSEIIIATKKEPEQRDFRDWMILFANSNDLSFYEGEDVDVSGLVALDKRLPDGYFYLNRKLVTHCVECAEDVSITCYVENGDEIPPADSWIEAAGKLELGKVGRQSVVVLNVEDYKIKTEPAESAVHP